MTDSVKAGRLPGNLAHVRTSIQTDTVAAASARQARSFEASQAGGSSLPRSGRPAAVVEHGSSSSSSIECRSKPTGRAVDRRTDDRAGAISGATVDEASRPTDPDLGVEPRSIRRRRALVGDPVAPEPLATWLSRRRQLERRSAGSRCRWSGRRSGSAGATASITPAVGETPDVVRRSRCVDIGSSRTGHDSMCVEQPCPHGQLVERPVHHADDRRGNTLSNVRPSVTPSRPPDEHPARLVCASPSLVPEAEGVSGIRRPSPALMRPSAIRAARCSDIGRSCELASSRRPRGVAALRSPR